MWKKLQYKIIWIIWTSLYESWYNFIGFKETYTHLLLFFYLYLFSCLLMQTWWRQHAEFKPSIRMGKKIVHFRCQRTMAKLFWTDRKATVTQVPTYRSTVCRRTSLNVQYVEPWRRWVIAAEGQTWSHLSKLRTEHWCYKIQDWKNIAWSEKPQCLLQG